VAAIASNETAASALLISPSATLISMPVVRETERLVARLALMVMGSATVPRSWWLCRGVPPIARHHTPGTSMEEIPG
jgi:hypothetical protein